MLASRPWIVGTKRAVHWWTGSTVRVARRVWLRRLSRETGSWTLTHHTPTVVQMEVETRTRRKMESSLFSRSIFLAIASHLLRLRESS